MYDLAQSRTKVCNHFGRYSIEVQVSIFVSRSNRILDRIVNDIDNFVREEMPIQEEEKVSGNPAAKARPKVKSSSTSGWDYSY